MTLSIQGTVLLTSWQVHLCPWERHLMVLILRVVDIWPTTPKRPCYGALIIFRDRRRNMQLNATYI